MDDNKKKLSYVPDIQYEEDYYSDGAIKPQEDNESDDSNIFDDSIMDHIQDNIDNLIQVIPLLPLDLQTVVNQVFKPIFNDWYTNIKGSHYPTYIPDPGKTIIKPKPDSGIEEYPGENEYPSNEDPGNITPDPYFPWNPPGTEPVGPRDPAIFTPEINDPVIKPDTNMQEQILPIDDDIFAPSSPFEIEYEKIDPVELVDLEYVRNIVDLYSYYTRKLKEVVNRFVLNCLSSIISANNETGENNAEQFILGNLTLGDTEVADDLRHLIDLGVRGEVNSSFKINFCLNNFSLESTLYHLKSFKAITELRRRYEEEQMNADGTKDGSKSDRMLKGLRQTYDKKYETSYINLYKHLNSSIELLEDTFNTLLLGINAKEILFKKGGNNK